MIKKKIPGSFVSVDVSRRTRKSKFLHQINTVVDWTVFEKELYKVCKRSVEDGSRQACWAVYLAAMTMVIAKTHLCSKLFKIYKLVQKNCAGQTKQSPSR